MYRPNQTFTCYLLRNGKRLSQINSTSDWVKILEIVYEALLAARNYQRNQRKDAVNPDVYTVEIVER